MAGKTRAETETIAANASDQLNACRTAEDVIVGWVGTFFSQLGSKGLITILNDKRLEIEAVARDLKRDVKQRVNAQATADRNNPYSPENLYKRGHPQRGAKTEWKRNQDRHEEARKNIVAEEKEREDLEFSEGEGVRGRQH